MRAVWCLAIWTAGTIIVAALSGWTATKWLGIWFGAWLAVAVLFALAEGPWEQWHDRRR